MSNLSTQPSFVTHPNSTPLSIPPPTMPSPLSTMSAVLSPLSTMPTILSPLSTMSTILSPPSTMSTILSPPSTMSTILSPPSTMSTILWSPSTMSTVLSPLSTMSTVLSPLSTMSTILSPPSTMSTILSPPSTMSTILWSPSTMSTILSPPSTMSTILWSPSSTLLSSQSTLTLPPNQTTCPSHDDALRVPLAVFYSLFFLVGLAGNLLALWVFLFLQRRRDSMHVLLMNCAVADLLLLACLPFRVHYLANGNQWELGAVACSLVTVVFYMNMYVNISMLGLISLDRYAWLRRRGGGARCTVGSPCGVRWTWVVCGLVWGLALGLMAYTRANMPQKAPEEANLPEKCFQYMRWDDGGCIASINVALEVMFWMVFIVQVVCYGKIAASRYGRTARKSFVVLLLFTLCFVPYHAFRPVYILSQRHPSAYDLCLIQQTHQVMVLFSAFNSCLDPVMYFLLSGFMRKAAAHAMGTHSCRVRDGE